MIQLQANAVVFIVHEAMNFRCGIDKTAAVARSVLEVEPMDGAFFVFRSKLGHSLRILHYDGSGFWLCTKRLSTGTFNRVWPCADSGKASAQVLARELQILLWGANPSGCSFPSLWRKIA